MWGRTDDVVPPISNTNAPNKSSDLDGWFYTVSDKVMSDWTEGKGCIGDGQGEQEETEKFEESCTFAPAQGE